MAKADDDLTLKLDKARWHALTDLPFYGQVAMGLKDVIDDQTPTACTDGRVIRWGREFLSKLTDEEARFVLLHEALHCAHHHLWRLPHDERGNIAADYKINQVLASVPGLSMPKGGLVCPKEWEGLAEEEIYSRLPPDPPKPKGGKGPSACGDFTAPAEPDKGGGKEEGEGGQGASLRDEWERRVIQAAQNAAAGRGTVPADMQRVLDRVREQPIDWRREMADFVRDVVSARNDWSRAARRHAWQSVLYPRKRADDLGLCIFARDTSGSISGELCAEFSAHITTALADAGCRGLVIDCDAAIQQEIWLAPGEECPLEAKGGGGTSFSSVFERAKELAEIGERVAGVVYLTDLEGSHWEELPECPVLWITTNKNPPPPPFGRVVPTR
jgi:predicted metal-dependent peptidase